MDKLRSARLFNSNMVLEPTLTSERFVSRCLELSASYCNIPLFCRGASFALSIGQFMVPFLDGVRKAKMTEQFHWTTLDCFGIDFKKRGKQADLSMRTE
mmetsp:Transcript_2309/g.4282  ORF Transcript_2309/g.4282 Transcript_2309/m.4282 type:complete len:99 (+) Transcript_2309:1200-1496(+)